MSLSVSLISVQERATEYLKKNPQAKRFRGIVCKTDADYFITDKKDPVYIKEFILETGSAILEVHLDRPARVWFECGTEVFVIGEEIAPGIIKAQILLFSGTRQVLDLGNTREFYLFPLAILLIGLLLNVFPLKHIFDFILPGDLSIVSIQIPIILMSIVGFYVVSFYIREYIPTLMTLTDYECLALGHLILMGVD